MSAVRALVGSFVGAVLANNPGLVFFMAGTVAGIYAEQTYKLPNMEDAAKGYYSQAKQMEASLRKGD